MDKAKVKWVESVFASAVALDQSGKEKNSIYGKGNTIYVLNNDRTLLLQFSQPDVSLFDSPISFYANDYDSDNFRVGENYVIFIQKGEEFIRERTCRKPLLSFDEVEGIFLRFIVPVENLITFHRNSLSLLDESLSHIEFYSKDKEIHILQRDIYSGSIIHLQREKNTGLGLQFSDEKIVKDFGPLGMRTNDFLALFDFTDKIYISPESEYFIITGTKNRLIGIVSGCLYDELGTIQNIGEIETPMEVKIDGRKIEKEGSKLQEINRGDQIRKRIKLQPQSKGLF